MNIQVKSTTMGRVMCNHPFCMGHLCMWMLMGVLIVMMIIQHKISSVGHTSSSYKSYGHSHTHGALRRGKNNLWVCCSVFFHKKVIMGI